MALSEKELTDREYQMLESRLKDYDKSHGLAYVLWFFLGGLGVHKFYIGKMMMGFVYPVLGIIGVGGFFASFANPENIGWWIFPSLILGCLMLYDLITIPGQIRNIKYKKKKQLLTSIEQSR